MHSGVILLLNWNVLP